MALKVTREEVWAGDIQDRPGGLADVLEKLAESGANLQCVIGRRQPDRPGLGVVFLTPIKGKKQQTAAREAGFSPSRMIATLRIEGEDQPGLGAKIVRTIGDAAVNVRGVSTAVLGKRFVCYLGFDSAEEASRAQKAMKKMKP